MNDVNIDYNFLLHGSNVEQVTGVDIGDCYNFFTGKKVLVTGGAGSIGSEIVRQLSKINGCTVIVFDNNEFRMFALMEEISGLNSTAACNVLYYIGSILDIPRVEQIFQLHKIDIVFHAGAYKHVPMMEHNPMESVKVNIRGSKIIVDMSDEYGVSNYVMVSSDKAVKPTSVMGCCKRVSELYTREKNENSGTCFISTRFGNVIGSSGSVVPIFVNRLKRGLPLQVTHKDIVRYFMTIPDAAKLVIKSTFVGQPGDVLMLDMGEPVKVYDVAKRFIEKYYTEGSINIIGLRPGEKMFEELSYNNEDIVKTADDRMFKLINTGQCINISDHQSFHDLVTGTNLSGDRVRELLKLLVNEYIY